MRIIFAPFTWLGRVCLWILFWPLGLWRSIRHSQAKRDRKFEKMMKKQED